MTIVYSDDFTVAADIDLTAYPSGSPDYEIIDGTLVWTVKAATDNVMMTSGSDDDTCYRLIDPAAPTGDQQITISSNRGAGSYQAFGPTVRCSAGGNYYALIPADTGTVELYRFDSGTGTLLQSTAIANAAGTHTYMLRAEGTGTTVTLTYSVDGGTEYSYNDTSASRKTSGTPGVWTYYYLTTTSWDDISIDDLATGSTVSPLSGSVLLAGSQPTIQSAVTASPITGVVRVAGGVPTVSVNGEDHYATTFDGTENPLSEGGAWHNDTTYWSPLEKYNGAAFPTVASPTGYNDNWGFLRDFSVPADQELTGVIYLNKTSVWTDSHEVELLVRCNQGANTMGCYEGDIGYPDTGEIVRWNGAPEDWTVIGTGGGSEATISSGDVVKFTVEGTALNLYRNGTLLRQATDATFATGQPGAGLFNRQDGTLREIGWDSFEATGLGVTHPATSRVLLKGGQPTVTAATTATASPAAGRVQVKGGQPTISALLEATANPITGSVRLKGAQPSISSAASATAQPASGAILLKGGQPAISSRLDATAQPLTGSVLLRGEQPSVFTGTAVTAQPLTGTVKLAGGVPSISAAYTVHPVTGGMLLVGGQPSISIYGEVIAQPQTGAIMISGGVPTVEGYTPGVWSKFSTPSTTWAKL